MSANYVARELGYGAADEWGAFDRATNAAFEPVETFSARFDALLGSITAIGFDAIDLGATGVEAAADEALGILVRQSGTERREHGLAHVILGGHQIQGAPLALHLRGDELGHHRIALLDHACSMGFGALPSGARRNHCRRPWLTVTR